MTQRHADPVDLAAAAIQQTVVLVNGWRWYHEGRAQRAAALVRWREAPVAAAMAADLLLRDFLRLARSGHWTVVDVVECSRRRLDRDVRDLFVEALWHDRHSAGVTGAWRAEVEAAVAEPRREPGVPWVAAFARDRGWSDEQVLDMIVAVLAEVRTWPDLRATSAGGRHGLDTADGAMLAKVRALLAKAERTEFEHEAEAFTAKAQSLMARHAIDRAVLEQDASPSDVAVTRVWLDAPYVTAKATLLNAVGLANRCRVVLTEAFGFVTIVGDAGDVRATTLLAASLQVQATRAMTAHGSRTRRDGSSSTRSFRQTFLVAYAGRIGERLTATVDAVAQSADRGALVPVLAARQRRVDQRFAELYPELKTREMTVADAQGWQAGRAAADLAHLGTDDALESSA